MKEDLVRKEVQHQTGYFGQGTSEKAKLSCEKRT